MFLRPRMSFHQRVYSFFGTYIRLLCISIVTKQWDIAYCLVQARARFPALWGTSNAAATLRFFGLQTSTET